jgi:hypothetical protein
MKLRNDPGAQKGHIEEIENYFIGIGLLKDSQS